MPSGHRSVYGIRSTRRDEQEAHAATSPLGYLPRVRLSRRDVLAAVPALTLEPAKGAWVTHLIPSSPVTHVYLPAGYSKKKPHPLVIALPGWNHTPELWRQKSDLAPFGDKHGCVIAMPAMGKTVYETSFFPGQRQPLIVPGAKLIGEGVLPSVRAEHAPLADRTHTAVIGYSTGGRGAVLLLEEYPLELSFAGSVSGTYDLMRLPPADGEYKIHAAVYGPRDAFKDRWEHDNCIAPARLDKLSGKRLYIAHGEKDAVVKPDQLEALRDALKGRDVVADFTLVPGAGHDWKLWSSQWAPMFEAAASTWGTK